MPDNDSEFYRTFKGGMDMLRLPAPETLFGGLSMCVTSIGAMANSIKTNGDKITVREMVLAFPLAGSTPLVAAATYEVTTAIGGMLGAFYLGACMGCMLAAAFDVYGLGGIARLGAQLQRIQHDIGSLRQLMRRASSRYPTLGHPASYLGMAGIAPEPPWVKQARE